jgi:hypothetical protein
MRGTPKIALARRRGEAEGRLYAARNQFREIHGTKRPDALSKAARGEMASHLPETPRRAPQRTRQSTVCEGSFPIKP